MEGVKRFCKKGFLCRQLGCRIDFNGCDSGRNNSTQNLRWNAKPFSFRNVMGFANCFSGIFRKWFSSGPEVRSTELCIVRAAGRYGSRSDYGEIENCTIRTESYDGKKLSVIEFKLRDKSKFRINTPVEKIVVPEDVSKFFKSSVTRVSKLLKPHYLLNLVAHLWHCGNRSNA